jgi:hypothetical protein
MEQSELLRQVVTILLRMRIPYLVTGSTATIYYGELRLSVAIQHPGSATSGSP